MSVMASGMVIRVPEEESVVVPQRIERHRAGGPGEGTEGWRVEEEGEERLPKKKALAIFSSDAISSSAYATEEILRALVLAGATAGVGYGYLSLSLPVSIALALLLGVVALSYRMIVLAYPTGGGS